MTGLEGLRVVGYQSSHIISQQDSKYVNPICWTIPLNVNMEAGNRDILPHTSYLQCYSVRSNSWDVLIDGWNCSNITAFVELVLCMCSDWPHPCLFCLGFFLRNLKTNRLSLCLLFPCSSPVWLHHTSSPGKIICFNVSVIFASSILIWESDGGYFQYNGFLPVCSELLHAMCVFEGCGLQVIFF